MDSDLLKTFLTIANTGTLTQAADQLGRTQSAISVQLRRLEDSLGVPLFVRNSKGMTLTPQGDTLLPKAQRIVRDIHDASALFADPLTGAIRLGLPDDFDDVVLEQILSNFARAHPDVSVIATSGCASGYPKALSDGTLDIAVCSGPDNMLGDTLSTDRPVFAAKAGLNLAPEDPVPLALLDRNCWWKDMPVTALNSVGRAHHIAFRSSSFASIQVAIRAGFAIGVLPGSSLCDQTVALTKSDGFPDLPTSRRSIVTAAHANTLLTEAMAQAIKNTRHF